MAGFIAKKLCPHIILWVERSLVPTTELTCRTELHFDTYIAASKAVREVLLQVSVSVRHFVTVLRLSMMKIS
jgi:hypothetical protein